MGGGSGRAPAYRRLREPKRAGQSIRQSKEQGCRQCHRDLAENRRERSRLLAAPFLLQTLEVVRRRGVALLGSHEEPLLGFIETLLHGPAGGIERAEIVLRQRMALLGRHQVPLVGVLLVLLLEADG